jgi:predicted phosphodiesterase
MRLALFSDIHGNEVALDAVLEDIARRGGVDAYWVLGDLVALGPAPVQVLERLTALPQVSFVRGNTDRYVYTGSDRPPPSMEDVRRNEDLIPILAECAGTFAWTQGLLSPTGWIEWLEALSLEVRMQLPDGTRVLGVHAAPGRDDGLGLLAGLSAERLATIVGDCSDDLVLAGHHHQTLDVRVGRHHLVNLGSVSNPLAPDLRASYVIVEAGQHSYEVSHHRVDYDRQAVIDEMQRLRHPGARYVISHLRGERPAS